MLRLAGYPPANSLRELAMKQARSARYRVERASLISKECSRDIRADHHSLLGKNR
jgi:hypothetical protein